MRFFVRIVVLVGLLLRAAAGLHTYLVDTKGADTPSCGEPTSPCKTLRYTSWVAQNENAANEAPLILMRPGVYPGECSESGIPIRIPLAIHGSGTVVIDCEGMGKALNISIPTSPSPSTAPPNISLSGLTFRHCRSRSSGGAVYMEQGREGKLLLSVESCHFEDASSLAASAGYFPDQSTSDYALSEGGGAICTRGGRLWIKDTSFKRCGAPNGGAGGAILMLPPTGHPSYKSSTLQKRRVYGRSQAGKRLRQRQEAAQRGRFDSSVDADHAGVEKGEAMKIVAGTRTALPAVELLDSQFVECTAGLAGGAVAAVLATASDLLVDGCQFHQNSLHNSTSLVLGGAFFLTYTPHMVVGPSSTFSNTSFTSNTIGDYNARGGGVAIDLIATRTQQFALLFDGCSFLNNNLTGPYAVTGGGLWMTAHDGYAENLNMIVRHCEFLHNELRSYGDGGPQAYGGGMFLEFSSSSARIIIDDCIFQGNLLHSVGDESASASGGGFAIRNGGGGKVFDSKIEVSSSTLADNVVLARDPTDDYGSVVLGGGAYLDFSEAAAHVLVSFDSCTFENNFLKSVGTSDGEPEAGGGAVTFQFVGEATDVNLRFMQSSFANNSLYAENENGTPLCHGGAVSLSYLDAAISVRTAFMNCLFADQTLVAKTATHSPTTIPSPQCQGGALDIYFDAVAESADTAAQNCEFLRNIALAEEESGGAGASFGGALYHQAVERSPSIHLVNCTVEENVAMTEGGGIWASQERANDPANLNLTVDDVEGEGYQYQFDCDATFAGVAREWDHQNSTLYIAHSTVRANRVVSASSANNASDGNYAGQEGVGGGVFVSNLRTTLGSSSVAQNTAGSSGGGIYLDSGSATLVLEGTTNVSANVAFDSGLEIFSSSGGTVSVRNTSKIEFAPRSVIGSAAAGVTLLTAGDLHYAEGTRLQCGAGEQLWLNTSQVLSTFAGWEIDCREIRSIDNGSRVEFVVPDCNLLQRGKDPVLNSNHSPIYTANASCLPLQPEMLMTSGTISCVPCSTGLYSLDRGYRKGGSVGTGEGPLLHAIECLSCPYGARCNDGGADVKVKAGFWASNFSHLGQTNAQSPRILTLEPCPAGYCCEDRHAGCKWDSDEACQGNRSQRFPLCGGCQPGFSQAIDGVGCVADQTCGGVYFARYLSLQLFVVWSGFVLYTLYASRYPPLMRQLDRRLHPPGKSTGSISVLVYYFQLAVVAVPRGYDSLVGRIASLAGELSNLRQLEFTFRGQTCAWRGMSMPDKLVWQMCLPLVLLVLLPLVSLVAPAVIGCVGTIVRYCTRLGARETSVDGSFHTGDDRTQPLLSFVGDRENDQGSVSNERGERSSEEEKEEDSLTNEHREGSSEEEKQEEEQEEERLESSAPPLSSSADDNGSSLNRSGGASSVSSSPYFSSEYAPSSFSDRSEDGRTLAGQWTQLAGAVTLLVVYSFTSVAESVLRLLNCVEIDGRHVLYYAGAVRCSFFGWQWAVVLVLLVVLLGPTFVVSVWRLRLVAPNCKPGLQVPSLQAAGPRITRRRSSVESFLSMRPGWEALGSLARQQRWPRTRPWRQVYQCASEPFDKPHWNWAAVLMLQRLLTVMCQALSTEPVTGSVGVSIVSFAFTLAHIFALPFHSQRVNQLQLIALVCLTLLSLLNSVQTAFASAGVDPALEGPLTDLVSGADEAMLVVFTLPLLYIVFTCSVCRLCVGAVGDGDRAADEDEGSVLDTDPLLDAMSAVSFAEHGTGALEGLRSEVLNLQREKQELQEQVERERGEKEKLQAEKEQLLFLPGY